MAFNLGEEAWNGRKDFYESLTLEDHGDWLEQEGASDGGWISQDLKNYENFWRRHIAPSTQRGIAEVDSDEWIRRNPHRSKEWNMVSQTSYTILWYLGQALRFRSEVKSGDRAALLFASILFSGNAVMICDSLNEVMIGVGGRGGIPATKVGKGVVGVLGSGTLTDVNRATRGQLSWKTARDEAVDVRNGLTHDWLVPIFVDSGSEDPVILRMSRTASFQQSWETIALAAKSSQNTVTLDSQADEAWRRSASLADWMYSHFTKELDAQLKSANYQALWGWTDPVSQLDTSNLEPYRKPLGSLGGPRNSDDGSQPFFESNALPPIPQPAPHFSASSTKRPSDLEPPASGVY